MKRIIITSGIMALGFSAILIFAGAAADSRSEGNGKSIFVSNKCNTCHSVQAQGVSKVGNEASTSKVAPPDLSGAGLKRNAAWIARYLQKKEAINGEKHLKKFKGSDEDLGILSAWLEAQKKKR